MGTAPHTCPSAVRPAHNMKDQKVYRMRLSGIYCCCCWCCLVIILAQIKTQSLIGMMILFYYLGRPGSDAENSSIRWWSLSHIKSWSGWLKYFPHRCWLACFTFMDYITNLKLGPPHNKLPCFFQLIKLLFLFHCWLWLCLAVSCLMLLMSELYDFFAKWICKHENVSTNIYIWMSLLLSSVLLSGPK